MLLYMHLAENNCQNPFLNILNYPKIWFDFGVKYDPDIYDILWDYQGLREACPQ